MVGRGAFMLMKWPDYAAAVIGVIGFACTWLQRPSRVRSRQRPAA